MGIELRLLDWNGNELNALPDVASLTLSPVLCDEGAIEFSYPKDGAYWQSIADLDEFPVAVYLDGVKQGKLEGVVKEQDGDDVAEAAVWKFTGFFNNGRLAEAVTYPAGWPTVNEQEPNQKYLSITVGALVATLLQQAQSRGTLAGFTYSSFNSSTDSNGQSWPSLVSIEYAPQVDYLTILKNLYDQQLCEFEVVGRDIRLYKPGTLSTDRTTGPSPLVFRAGRDLSDSPRKRSTRDLGTVMLGAGSDGLYVERVNADEVAARRRIESTASQGQVSDMGTLILYTDAELSRISSAKMEKTHGLIFGDDTVPRPVRDFDLGDWAFSDVGKGNERLRIKQWTISLGADGVLSGSVVLNDLFAEQTERLSERIKGIVGGSTITGGSAAERDLPAGTTDEIAPSAPVSMTLSSTAYMDNQGQTFANVAATWTQVTTNSDGTILEDLEGYTVRWRYSGETAWRYIPAVMDTTATWSPVTPGLSVEAQVSAHDRIGNASGWSPSPAATVITGKDTTPPGVPSTPIGDNYLGLTRFRYDGKTASGAALAPDLNIVEVHVSSTSGFTPDRTANSTTRIDSLSAAGSSFYKGTYGVTYYAKFVAVDKSGNASAASAQGSAVGTQVVSNDVLDGAIGTAKIANLAVTSAKVGLAQINTAQIGSLDVGRLVSGTMIADVIMSGRFMTAPVGARVEVNSLGLQKFNSSEQLLVNITGSEALLTGTYKTAPSGRRIEMDSTNQGMLRLISEDGTIGFIRSLTESDNKEAIQFGIGDPVDVNETLWNRINFNTEEWATYRTDIVEFVFGQRMSVYSTTDKALGDNNSPIRFQVTPTSFTINDSTNKSNLRFNLTPTDLFLSAPSGTVRVWLNETGNQFTIYDTNAKGRLMIDVNSTTIWGNDDVADVQLKPTEIQFTPSTDKTALVLMDGQGQGSHQSVGLKMLAPPVTQGGGYGGGIIKIWDVQFEMKDVLDSGFLNVKANSFISNSDESVKTGIEDFTGDALAGVRRTHARTYYLRADASKKQRLGLVAQEAPPEIVTVGGSDDNWGIDHYQAITYLWAAVAQLAQQVEDLKKGKP